MKTGLAIARKKLGIPPFEFYQFRHLLGTEYLRALRDANAIATLMGNRGSKMADQRYGHMVDRLHPRVADLDAKFRGAMASCNG